MPKPESMEQKNDRQETKVKIRRIAPAMPIYIQGVLPYCPLTDLELKAKAVDEISEPWNSESRA